MVLCTSDDITVSTPGLRFFRIADLLSSRISVTWFRCYYRLRSWEDRESFIVLRKQTVSFLWLPSAVDIATVRVCLGESTTWEQRHQEVHRKTTKVRLRNASTTSASNSYVQFNDLLILTFSINNNHPRANREHRGL